MQLRWHFEADYESGDQLGPEPVSVIQIKKNGIPDWNCINTLFLNLEDPDNFIKILIKNAGFDIVALNIEKPARKLFMNEKECEWIVESQWLLRKAIPFPELNTNGLLVRWQFDTVETRSFY
jgi:hypothetical protein